jgi:hypothetical protein
MAPTYPESDVNDLMATLKAIAALDPITIFHEPINLRADNAARIARAASGAGQPMRTDVFATRESWQAYALEALQRVWALSHECGVQNKTHLWPDAALGTKRVIRARENPERYLAWLKARWNRISEWPKNEARQSGVDRSVNLHLE